MNANPVENLQSKHYDRISSEYESHYDDLSSQAYRKKFIYDPLFEDINLYGKSVLEAMCGSGQTTSYLLSRGAKVTGLDISIELLESFKKRWPQCRAVNQSIFKTSFPNNSFDIVVVIGGLHHLHPDVEDGINEIYRILRPGGEFCFMEPHTGSIPDIFRRIWYRNDSLFEKGEEAIDIEFLEQIFSNNFKIKKRIFIGNFAYLIILNSLVFRIPLIVKPYLARPLFAVEKLLAPFQAKLNSCVVLGRWRKKWGIHE